MYEMVDIRHSRHLVTRSVPDHHSIPALLQLPRCLHQEPGTPLSLKYGRKRQQKLIRAVIVLAITHHLCLLWPPFTRSPLPCLLSPAILQASGGVIRTVACALFMAIALRNVHPSMSISNAVDAFPRFRIEQQFGLYLVSEESRDEA